MRIILAVIFFFGFHTAVTCQNFTAAAVLGLNASQINGDFLAGYDKLGLTAGLKVVSSMKEKLDISVELLWSQRGSRDGPFTNTHRKIHLDYAEIPVMIIFKDWLVRDYYKIWFESGLSYGRLVRNKITYIDVETLADTFNSNDISFLVGATFFANSNWGWSLRFTSSINPLLNNKDPGNQNFSRLRGYFLTFRSVLFF